MERNHIVSPAFPDKKSSVPGLTKAYEPKKDLQILLKTDAAGTREAIVSALETLKTPQTGIEVIQAGIGNVGKSDLLMAEAGSRLIIAFNVGILPRVKELAKEHQVEVRLYRVIYNLLEDLKGIVSSLNKKETETERITGRARVIALFPGGRKSIILGCEVEDGVLGTGQKFRLISAPGPVYAGTIESLQIENHAVQQAKVGQQVGLKISAFKRARIGDIVECFEVDKPKKAVRWQPKGGVFRF